MKYRYEPLPHVEEGNTDPYIRILELHPGEREGRITGALKQTRLSQAEPYEALSYCWGSTRKRKIYINPASSAGPSEGRYLLVPASLIPFLYRTRAHPLYKGRARLLWIDSICINQDDDHEKNAQVACMRDIYMHAKHTAIWLGEAAAWSAEALEYMYKLSRKGYLQEETQKRMLSPEEEREKFKLSKVKVTIGDPKLEAIFALLDRPYFERAWIVQEVVVSKTAHVVVGDNSQTWAAFVWALLYLVQHNAWIFEFYQGAESLGLVMSLLLTKVHWEHQIAVNWWILLIRHRHSRSGNPQDKIFSVWGLGCKEQLVDLGVRPNYSESANKTFWHLAFRAFETGLVRLLHIPRICIDEKHEMQGLKALDVPSWVPDWRCTEVTAHPLMSIDVGDLADAPSFVYQSTPESTFSCGLRDVDAETGLPRTLVLKGHVIAEVTHITPRSWNFAEQPKRQTLYSQAKMLQYNQRQILEWWSVYHLRKSRSRTYEPTQEIYFIASCKTLIAGSLPKHKESAALKSYEAFESRQRFLRLITNMGLGECLWIYVCVVCIERFLRAAFRYQNPEMEFRNIAGPMQGRKGARIAVTIEEPTGDAKPRKRTMEYLALVPTQTRLGDEMVLCQGVDSPLVLRRKSQQQDGEATLYELVGDAYVHGAMEGELWHPEQCEKILIR